MSLKPRKKRERKIVSNINVVPYIDVMLVLLIIFMITTPMLTQGVKVNLPNASAKSIPNTSKKPLILTVDKDGNFYSNIGSKTTLPVSIYNLKNIVNQNFTRNSKLPVYVRGDTDTSYGQVVRLMVTLQKIGISNIGLVTQDVKST